MFRLFGVLTFWVSYLYQLFQKLTLWQTVIFYEYFFIEKFSYQIKFIKWRLLCIDAHRGGGGEGGIKVYPPSKIFAKLVNKNAIKHQKVVPFPQNFHNPYIPSLPKFGKKLPDPPPWIFKPCASMLLCYMCKVQNFLFTDP
jgi:hypothetical protein